MDSLMTMVDTTGPAGAHDGPPPREGIALLRWVLLAAWLPLLLLALAAPIAATFSSGSGLLYDPFERVGLWLKGGSTVPFSAEAKSSGLKRGDEIVAIDGRSVPGRGVSPSLDQIATQIAGLNGSKVRVTIRSSDGMLDDHVLTRRDDRHQTFGIVASPSIMFGVDAAARLLGAYALIAAAILLFIKRRDRWVPTLLSFGLILLSMAIPGRAFFNELQLLQARYTVMITGYTALYLGIMLFPDGRFSPRWMRWVALVLVLTTPAGPLGLVNMDYWPSLRIGFLLISVASLLLRYWRLPNGIQRQQIRWALFGFAICGLFLLPAITNEFFILGGNVSPIAWSWSALADDLMVSLAWIAVAGGLIVSLLRYKLYDADRVIARSATFGTLALVLVALFAGTEKVIELLGEQLFGERLGVLAGGIGAAFAALMIVPLHHRLTRWAEHKFQKQLIRLKHGLPLLVGDMRETAPVKRIAAATLDSVSHGVRASRSALVFEGDLLDARGIEAEEVERWRHGWTPPRHDDFDIDRDDPLFPLRVPLAADGHGRIGWLLLGPRPDGSFYGKDERETLAAIADPVARALEIAAARERREADEQQRWRAQESLNAEIRSVNIELVRVLGSLDTKLSLLLQPPAQAAE